MKKKLTISNSTLKALLLGLGVGVFFVVWTFTILAFGGGIEEDSIWWNCLTMGNRICGDVTHFFGYLWF